MVNKRKSESEGKSNTRSVERSAQYGTWNDDSIFPLAISAGELHGKFFREVLQSVGQSKKINLEEFCMKGTLELEKMELLTKHESIVLKRYIRLALGGPPRPPAIATAEKIYNELVDEGGGPITLAIFGIIVNSKRMRVSMGEESFPWGWSLDGAIWGARSGAVIGGSAGGATGAVTGGIIGSVVGGAAAISVKYAS